MRAIGTIRIVMVAVVVALLGAPTAAAEVTYTVAVAADNPPFAYETPDGRLIGIDVDLLNYIGSDQRFDVVIEQLPFDDALSALRDGRVDAVMSAAPVTTEQQSEFDLSAPYFESGLQMAVPQRTDDIWSYDDLGGKRVAVVADSPAARFAESIQPRYDFSVVPARGVDEMYAAVRSGNAQALVDDYARVNFDIAGGSGFKTVTRMESSGGAALLVGSSDGLLETFDAGLTSLRASGKYDQVLTRYLGGRGIAQPEIDSTSPDGIIDQVTSVLDKLWAPILGVIVLLALGTFRRIARGLRRAADPRNQSVAVPIPPMAPPPPAPYRAVDPDDPEARIRELERYTSGGHELGTDK